MKVGSLVECVSHTDIEGFDSWTPEIKYNTPYDAIDIGIKLGEFVIELAQFPNMWYAAVDFREIQFPPSLEAEIKECLTKEFELA